jgi:phage shock protein A
MPFPLIPIVISLLAGGTGGGIIGYLFGKSEAAEAIERLQKLILENQQIIRNLEVGINQLEKKISALENEISIMKARRGAIQKFIRWVASEHPEVISRYEKMKEAKNKIVELQEQLEDRKGIVERAIERTMEKYPKEMRELLAQAG